MTTSPGFSASMVILALVALSAVVFVPIARAAPPPDAGMASGGIVPQSPNCSAGQAGGGEGCVPRGPGSPTGPGEPVLPPVTPPVTPPTIPRVTPPITPPAFPLSPPTVGPPEELQLPAIISGWAKATMHITDDNQDVTYVSGEVPLVFYKRAVQDMEGNTQYLLKPGLFMIWAATGREFGCTIEGQALITFPIHADTEFTLADPTRDRPRPAYGYLNVVGPDGGDFHSVMVSAFDPNARVTKICPGKITKEGVQAGFLLHTVRQKNSYEGDLIIFKGTQSQDSGNPLDFLKLLPPGAGDAISDDMRKALSEAAGSGPRVRYTWEWELKAVGSAP